MYFPDLRNKFGALHKQYTTNRERELFSTYDTQTHRDWLTVVLGYSPLYCGYR